MAVNTKVVKERIKSVGNTKKITQAMEMVSAAKMRKAVAAVVNTKDYAALARKVMKDLSQSGEKTHPLLVENEADKTLYVVITSNRGLCGNFNAAVLADFSRSVKALDKSKEVDVLAIGKKVAQYAKKKGLGLIGMYDKMSEKPKFEDILPVSRTIIDAYIEKKYDRINLIYTNYISGLNQEVKVRQLLPFSGEQLDQMQEEIGEDDKTKSKSEITDFDITDYKLEPTKNEVLSYVIPRLVEIQIFQALLESAASEHSSRMIAMKNAGDSASDMIDDLVLQFNKGRQAAITSEIAEIVRAGEAMK